MRFAIMVTGPAYGTQQASSALQFAHALLKEGHELCSVFFYREGVYNANFLTSPASDEYDLVRAWQQLNQQRSDWDWQGLIYNQVLTSAGWVRWLRHP